MKKYIQIDTFTRQKFKGNPAAVFANSSVNPGEMQAIAMELNQGATVFLAPDKDQKGHFHIRWFNAHNEIQLCGHGTLAAAHALWSEGLQPHYDNIHFHYGNSGETITVSKREQHICMKMPKLEPAEILPIDSLRHIEEKFLFLGQAANKNILMVMESEKQVADFIPSASELSNLPGTLIITAPSSSSDRDVVCRVFAPNYGLLEDQVTGSAHCTLAPYWFKKLNKNQISSEQISHRSGVVHCEADTSSDQHIILSGLAVTTAKGILI